MQMHRAQHADELLTVAWLNKYMISYNIYDSPGDCINYANKKQGEPAAERRQREDEGAALAGFTAEIITCECRCQTDCKIEFFAQILTRFARPVE